MLFAFKQPKFNNLVKFSSIKNCHRIIERNQEGQSYVFLVIYCYNLSA